MGTHIKIFRELSDKSFYSKDSEKVHLWIHLLLCANWTDKEEMFGGKPIVCKAGQFTTGRKQLAMQTGISESKIERILTYFEKIEHQIEQQKTNTNRLISIVNWDKYQYTEQQTKQRVNNKRTTSEQRVNTLKECKEGEECKEVNTKTWKDDFLVYKNECRKAFVEFDSNTVEVQKQERLNPNVDIKLTIEKAYDKFWSTEAGWKNKKKSGSENIDWVATIKNAISVKSNIVYKPK